MLPEPWVIDNVSITEIKDTLEEASETISKVEAEVEKGDKVILIESSNRTKRYGMKIGNTYTVKRVGKSVFGLQGFKRTVSKHRFKKAKAEKKDPYPSFDWDNFDADGCDWITGLIKTMEDRTLPSIDNIADIGAGWKSIEFIDMVNLDDNHLHKVWDQALTAINKDWYTEWFVPYLNYVITCIQWHRDNN